MSDELIKYIKDDGKTVVEINADNIKIAESLGWTKKGEKKKEAPKPKSK
jgi:hypothetical protein